jgi:predicted NBD/HSP70 family sugar kinase
MSLSSGDQRGRRHSPGSQTSLRNRNQQRVVDALVQLGPTTQADLARRTGLSTATISNIVAKMVTDSRVSVAPITQHGRRAALVSLLSESRTVAAGIGFGRRHLRVVLVYPDFQIAGEESIALPQGYKPSNGVNLARDLLTRLLEHAGLSPSSLVGIGVGLAGAINQHTRLPVAGAVSAEWEDFDLVHEFGSHFPVPVEVDNDANLGALAEVIWGPYGRASNLIYVKLGTGIGAGLILGGVPFGGTAGVTGEIGHFQVVPGGRACRCGNQGCLEAEASTSAMIERVRPNVSTIESVEELTSLALGGDAAVIRVIQDAALHVGHIVGDLSSVLNPEFVVIGGPLADLGELLLEPIRRGFARRTLPLVRDSTALELSTLDDRGEALGAAALVLRQSRVEILA